MAPGSPVSMLDSMSVYSKDTYGTAKRRSSTSSQDSACTDWESGLSEVNLECLQKTHNTIRAAPQRHSSEDSLVCTELLELPTARRDFPTLRDLCTTVVEPSQLEVVETCGTGAVDLCQAKGIRGHKTVVVKRLREDLMTTGADLETFAHQASRLASLGHRNLCKVLGVGSTNETDFSSLLKSTYIVEEYMDGNTLFDLVMEQMLHPTKRLYPAQSGLFYIQQVASAISYLHGMSPPVIHSDLKLTNIMMHHGNVDRPREAMVTDYGLEILSEKHHHEHMAAERKALLRQAATGEVHDHKLTQARQFLEDALAGQETIRQSICATKAYQKEHGRLTGFQGSFSYTAPEVTNEQPCDEKVDVFAIGVILYELFSRQLVRVIITGVEGAPTPTALLALELFAYKVAAGYRMTIPAHWPAPLRQLVSDCWAQEPSARPSMKEVCERLSDYELVTTVKDLDNFDARSAAVALDAQMSFHEAQQTKQGCRCTIM